MQEAKFEHYKRSLRLIFALEAGATRFVKLTDEVVTQIKAGVIPELTWQQASSLALILLKDIKAKKPPTALATICLKLVIELYNVSFAKRPRLVDYRDALFLNQLLSRLVPYCIYLIKKDKKIAMTLFTMVADMLDRMITIQRDYRQYQLQDTAYQGHKGTLLDCSLDLEKYEESRIILFAKYYFACKRGDANTKSNIAYFISMKISTLENIKSIYAKEEEENDFYDKTKAAQYEKKLKEAIRMHENYSMSVSDVARSMRRAPSVAVLTRSASLTFTKQQYKCLIEQWIDALSAQIRAATDIGRCRVICREFTATRRTHVIELVNNARGIKKGPLFQVTQKAHQDLLLALLDAMKTCEYPQDSTPLRSLKTLVEEQLNEIKSIWNKCRQPRFLQAALNLILELETAATSFLDAPKAAGFQLQRYIASKIEDISQFTCQQYVSKYFPIASNPENCYRVARVYYYHAVALRRIQSNAFARINRQDVEDAYLNAIKWLNKIKSKSKVHKQKLSEYQYVLAVYKGEYKKTKSEKARSASSREESGSWAKRRKQSVTPATAMSILSFRGRESCASEVKLEEEEEDDHLSLSLPSYLPVSS